MSALDAELNSSKHGHLAKCCGRSHYDLLGLSAYSLIAACISLVRDQTVNCSIARTQYSLFSLSRYPAQCLIHNKHQDIFVE